MKRHGCFLFAVNDLVSYIIVGCVNVPNQIVLGVLQQKSLCSIPT